MHPRAAISLTKKFWTVSRVPWAVIFAHPADGSLPIPRHPVQLYEAGFYLLTFAVLMLLWKKWCRKDGKIAGLFFVPHLWISVLR